MRALFVILLLEFMFINPALAQELTIKPSLAGEIKGETLSDSNKIINGTRTYVSKLTIEKA